jgi:hypothetical protein
MVTVDDAMLSECLAAFKHSGPAGGLFAAPVSVQ